MSISKLTNTVRNIVEADYANKGYISNRIRFATLNDAERDLLLNAVMNDYTAAGRDLRYELIVESPNFQHIVEFVHGLAKNQDDLCGRYRELGELVYQNTLSGIEEMVDKEIAEQSELLEQLITYEQQTILRLNNTLGS